MSRVPRGYWTLERCKEVALQCESATDMHKRFGSAYTTAVSNGWLEHLKLPLPLRYTLQMCQEAAGKCKSRWEMDKRFPGPYGAAKRNGWLDQIGIPSTRKVASGYWSKERCQEAAATCKTLAEFGSKFDSAYQRAYRKGWLDQLGLPPAAKKSDADTFYVWRADGVFFNGAQVYKTGITSWRRGERRIEQVAGKAKLDYTIVMFVKVEVKAAYALEKFALALGVDPKIDVPDGGTEFRAYTEQDVTNIRAFALSAT